MGKSDNIIFREYWSMLLFNKLGSVGSTAFLGFQGENVFTHAIESPVKHYYDLALGNWEINSDWGLRQKYDLIICTRCPYFASNPDDFMARVRDHLIPGGHALIDWGLGDHWRFKRFKVGWIRDGEHEHAYGEDNRLHSVFWNSSLNEHVPVRDFWAACVKNGHYLEDEQLDEVISREVPAVIDYDVVDLKTRFLWPDDPQLYIITLVRNE